MVADMSDLLPAAHAAGEGTCFIVRATGQVLEITPGSAGTGPGLAAARDDRRAGAPHGGGAGRRRGQAPV
jgi:hypothetical protein